MSEESEKMDVPVTQEGDGDVTILQQEQGETASQTAKPMTEEEKAERLKRAEERIKQRKLEIQEEERQREIEREKARRRDGQDMTKIKADIEWREAQKLAAERKREKMEDRLVRQRVLEQIAKDRADMKAKQANAHHSLDQTASSHHNWEEEERMRIRVEIARDRENVKAQKELDRQQHAGSSTKPAPAAEPQTVKKDYTEAKIQIRLPNNTKLVQTFGADEPLSAVRLYVDVNSHGELGPFIDLSTSYPRKIFTDDEMQMSLRVLDLIPTAVLLAVKGKDPGNGTAI